ncbi:MAG: adenine deaminase [Thermodesulfobacteriota bacterium]
MDEAWLERARGDRPVDLLLKDARLINVFSGSVQEADVGIYRGRFVGWGAYKAKRVIRLDGMYLAPGFIDGHCHLESTMLTPREFARAVIPHGTTAVVADPHEIANVLGMEGIRYLLEASSDVPLRLHFMLPSCVPATHLETSGASLTARELSLVAREKWVLGLGEMMNFPGLIDGDPTVLEKVRAFQGRLIDGHAPGLGGERLNAYISCGIRSDHECTSLGEAMEKLQRGMWIMIREGSTARNLEGLIPLVNERTARRCLLVTDDRTPEDLSERGHLDAAIEKAVALGLDPVLAVQMVTINPSNYFGLRDLGAIGPGYWADAVVLSELNPPSVEMSFFGGRLIWEKGRAGGPWGKATKATANSFSIGGLTLAKLRVESRGGFMRVMELVPGQIVTKECRFRPKVRDGVVVSDPSRDLLKLVVAERHHSTGRVGVGFVRGFGLKRGALASSVAHDSHNVVAVGVEDGDLLKAIQTVAGLQGGLVVVEDGRVKERLPLPIAGLISPWPLHKVARRHRKVREAAMQLGCALEDPFMVLSFLALPVIPDLKLTDLGLVDVNQFKTVDLFE